MGGPNPHRYPPSIADHIKLRDWMKENPAWVFSVDCIRCVNAKIFHPRDLLKHPQVRRIGDIKARLICKECKGRYVRIHPALLARRD